MRRRILLGAGCGLLTSPLRAAPPEREELDLLLVLAADVSQSMQARELALQREGYVAALRDPAVLEAIGSGPCGAIGMVYLEWSGSGDQRVLVPWSRIGGAEDAAGFAATLAGKPQRGGDWTSISGAIGAARRLLAAAPFRADRQVLDISGDGENNHGEPAHIQRDLAMEEGATINGLPILRDRAAVVDEAGETALEQHYRRNVIGGGGAFLLPARGFDSFAGAIRRKLVMEIAGTTPSGVAQA